MQPVTDAELITRLGLRDQDALVDLHSRYASLVYSVAARILEDQGASEEVTQDVFMRFWNRPEMYDASKGRLSTWLMNVARNLAIDRVRQLQSHTPRSGLLFLDEDPDRSEALLGNNGLDNERQTLRSVIGQLPDEQRIALELAYFQGLSPQEIALVVHAPLATVKSRLQRGMQKLRDLWLTEKT
jgi:RNA polymerase sigma-70 factor, ECF subfamily